MPLAQSQPSNSFVQYHCNAHPCGTSIHVLETLDVVGASSVQSHSPVKIKVQCDHFL